MKQVNDICKPYTDLIKRVLETGDEKGDRTGTGTLSVFGGTMCFDVRTHAPFLTQRKLPLKSVIGELLWFLEGNESVSKLRNVYKCSFWDEWANENLDSIGPIYGNRWVQPVNTNMHVDFGDGEQYLKVTPLRQALEELAYNPESRRMVVVAWDPQTVPISTAAIDKKYLRGLVPTKPSDNVELDKGALAPCHFAFQLNAVKDPNDGYNSYWVDLQWYQRSVDIMLGLPNNIASYYILLNMICSYVSRAFLFNGNGTFKPRNLICSYGDAHIYKNHIENAKELLNREIFEPATMEIDFELTRHLIDVFHNVDYTDDAWSRSVQNDLFKSINNYIAGDKIEFARNV